MQNVRLLHRSFLRLYVWLRFFLFSNIPTYIPRPCFMASGWTPELLPTPSWLLPTVVSWATGLGRVTAEIAFSPISVPICRVTSERLISESRPLLYTSFAPSLLKDVQHLVSFPQTSSMYDLSTPLLQQLS